MTISDEGAVTSGTVSIGQNTGGSATIEVNSGGSLVGSAYLIGRFGTGSDGHLIVTGTDSTASTTDITVGNEGTGVMDILNGGVVTTTGTPIIGNVAGSNGTVTISGTNSQWTLSDGSGTVTVGGSGTGSLNVSNGGTLLGSASVGGTGTLGSDGTIAGSVTNAGLVSPGNSAGILEVMGNYIQTSDGILQIELGGTTVGAEYDQLFSLAGTATLEGTLNLLSINSFAPSLGNSFQILNFSEGISGSFDNINAFSLGSGLAWDFDDLYTTGTISVIPEPATMAALLGALALGLVLWRRSVRRPR